jgi:hypothetical protein
MNGAKVGDILQRNAYMPMQIFRHKQVYCHGCRAPMNAYARSGSCECPPGIGDITICVKCGAAHEFTADGLRRLSAEETIAFAREYPEASELLAAYRRMEKRSEN